MLRETRSIETNPQNFKGERKMKSARISKLIAVAAVITFPAALVAQAATQVADTKTVPAVETTSIAANIPDTAKAAVKEAKTS